MKAVMRSSIMTILVLIGIFSISASAQAFFSVDQESIDLSHRGVTQAQSLADVSVGPLRYSHIRWHRFKAGRVSMG